MYAYLVCQADIDPPPNICSSTLWGSHHAVSQSDLQGLMQIEERELQAEAERMEREMELEKAREAERQKKLDETAAKQQARQREIDEKEVLPKIMPRCTCKVRQLTKHFTAADSCCSLHSRVCRLSNCVRCCLHSCIASQTQSQPTHRLVSHV